MSSPILPVIYNPFVAPQIHSGSTNAALKGLHFKDCLILCMSAASPLKHPYLIFSIGSEECLYAAFKDSDRYISSMSVLFLIYALMKKSMVSNPHSFIAVILCYGALKKTLLSA